MTLPTARESDRFQIAPTTQVPLCIDLDGTLLRSDILLECLAEALHRPLVVLRTPYYMARGKAFLKARLALAAPPDVKTLPYDPNVLELIEKERASGRRIVLMTATDRKIANQISAHLGLFDEVIGSDGATNLRGKQKSEELLRRFGARGFSYAGNDESDVAVWKESESAIVIDNRLGLQRGRWMRVAGDLAASLATVVALAGVTTPHLRIMLVAGALALLWSGVRTWYRDSEVPLFNTNAMPSRAIALVALLLVARIPLVAVQNAFAGEFTTIRVRQDDPWRGVQEWAKQHTPREAVFLVPLNGDVGFEIFSERAARIDLKRGAAVMWSPPYYWLFTRRRQGQSDATDPRAFAAAHDTCYAVIRADDPARTLPRAKWPDPTLPVVYANRQYDILALCGRTP